MNRPTNPTQGSEQHKTANEQTLKEPAFPSYVDTEKLTAEVKTLKRDLRTAQDDVAYKDHQISRLLFHGKVRSVLKVIGIVIASLIVVAGAVFGLHAWYVHSVANTHAKTTAWSDQCTQAGGQVFQNPDRGRTTDLCVFPNGANLPRNTDNQG